MLTKSYHWKVLLQGMLNSLTLCKYFVQQPLEMLYQQFPHSIFFYHYMSDILLTDSAIDILERMFDEEKKILHAGDCK